MKVQTAILKFAASPSPDVAGYRLYMEPDGNPVSYNSEFFDLGNPVNDEGVVEIDLSTLPGMTTKDGVYNLGVVAVDDTGNQSSMKTKDGVNVDFEAPDPPGEIELIFS